MALHGGKFTWKRIHRQKEYVATPKYTPSKFFSDSSLFEKRGSDKLNTIKCNMRKYVLIIPT